MLSPREVLVLLSWLRRISSIRRIPIVHTCTRGSSAFIVIHLSLSPLTWASIVYSVRSNSKDTSSFFVVSCLTSLGFVCAGPVFSYSLWSTFGLALSCLNWLLLALVQGTTIHTCTDCYLYFIRVLVSCTVWAGSIDEGHGVVISGKTMAENCSIGATIEEIL